MEENIRTRGFYSLFILVLFYFNNVHCQDNNDPQYITTCGCKKMIKQYRVVYRDFNKGNNSFIYFNKKYLRQKKQEAKILGEKDSFDKEEKKKLDKIDCLTNFEIIRNGHLNKGESIYINGLLLLTWYNLIVDKCPNMKINIPKGKWLG